MKTCSKILRAAAAAALAPLAVSANTVIEDFGSNLQGDLDTEAGGQGFSAAWPSVTGTTPVVNPATALTYALTGHPSGTITINGADTATTFAAQVQAASVAIHTRPFTTAFPQTANVWISALVRFNNGVVEDQDQSTLAFTSTGDLRIGIIVETDGSADYVVNLGGTQVRGGGDVTESTSVSTFLVARVVSNGTQFTSLDLWVNPTYAELNGLTGIDATSSATPLNAPVDQLQLRELSLDNPAGSGSDDHILWDRIVVGQSMLAVIPEPSTYAAIGAVGLLAGVTFLRARSRRTPAQLNP